MLAIYQYPISSATMTNTTPPQILDDGILNNYSIPVIGLLYIINFYQQVLKYQYTSNSNKNINVSH